MSTGAHPELHRVHWLQRWVVRLLVALVAAAGIVLGIVVGVDRAFLSGQTQYSWPPEACVVQGIDARCGSFVVPESRTKPNGRTIGLNVVVLPASLKPARSDAVAYLAGGPGDAATELAATRSQQLTVLNVHRDILLGVHGRTGDEFASVVHAMLLDMEKAVSIPLVVSRAEKGDYGPLDRAGSGDLNPRLGLMTSIWCNEPWVGLDATGPWGHPVRQLHDRADRGLPPSVRLGAETP